MTLAFLGHRPEEDVEAAAAVIAGLPPAAPPLRIAGALLLPPRRARVLCAALADDEGVLAALQAAASAGLETAGLYIPERRPFRPHVTVARLRAGARAPRQVTAVPDPMAFCGEAVTLYHSRLAGRAPGTSRSPRSRWCEVGRHAAGGRTDRRRPARERTQGRRPDSSPPRRPDPLTRPVRGAPAAAPASASSFQGAASAGLVAESII